MNNSNPSRHRERAGRVGEWQSKDGGQILLGASLLAPRSAGIAAGNSQGRGHGQPQAGVTLGQVRGWLAAAGASPQGLGRGMTEGETRVQPRADLSQSLSTILIFQTAAFMHANNTLYLHTVTTEYGQVTRLGTNLRAATSYSTRKKLSQPGCRAVAPWHPATKHSCTDPKTSGDQPAKTQVKTTAAGEASLPPPRHQALVSLLLMLFSLTTSF